MDAMLTVVIQAGGRSSRMGSDKALVPLGGRALIEYALEAVAGLGDETIITTNNPGKLEKFGITLAQDPVPGAGALHGLQTALRAAHGAHVLLAACDMPFMQRPLLERLAELAPEAAVVIPRPGGQYEPLLAVYERRRCLAAVEAALAAGDRRMISFLPGLDVIELGDALLEPLDPQHLSFFNVNNAQDLQQAQRMLQAGGRDENHSGTGGNQA